MAEATAVDEDAATAEVVSEIVAEVVSQVVSRAADAAEAGPAPASAQNGGRPKPQGGDGGDARLQALLVRLEAALRRESCVGARRARADELIGQCRHLLAARREAAEIAARSPAEHVRVQRDALMRRLRDCVNALLAPAPESGPDPHTRADHVAPLCAFVADLLASGLRTQPAPIGNDAGTRRRGAWRDGLRWMVRRPHPAHVLAAAEDRGASLGFQSCREACRHPPLGLPAPNPSAPPTTPPLSDAASGGKAAAQGWRVRSGRRMGGSARDGAAAAGPPLSDGAAVAAWVRASLNAGALDARLESLLGDGALMAAWYVDNISGELPENLNIPNGAAGRIQESAGHRDGHPPHTHTHTHRPVAWVRSEDVAAAVVGSLRPLRAIPFRLTVGPPPPGGGGGGAKGGWGEGGGKGVGKGVGNGGREGGEEPPGASTTTVVENSAATARASEGLPGFAFGWRARLGEVGKSWGHARKGSGALGGGGKGWDGAGGIARLEEHVRVFEHEEMLVATLTHTHTHSAAAGREERGEGGGEDGVGGGSPRVPRSPSKRRTKRAAKRATIGQERLEVARPQPKPQPKPALKPAPTPHPVPPAAPAAAAAAAAAAATTGRGEGATARTHADVAIAPIAAARPGSAPKAVAPKDDVQVRLSDFLPDPSDDETEGAPDDGAGAAGADRPAVGAAASAAEEENGAERMPSFDTWRDSQGGDDAAAGWANPGVPRVSVEEAVDDALTLDDMRDVLMDAAAPAEADDAPLRVLGASADASSSQDSTFEKAEFDIGGGGGEGALAPVTAGDGRVARRPSSTLGIVNVAVIGAETIGGDGVAGRAFTAYQVAVWTSGGPSWLLRRRYRQFVKLRRDLLALLPPPSQGGDAAPPGRVLPAPWDEIEVDKVWHFGGAARRDAAVVESRRALLSECLRSAVLGPPPLCALPPLWRFLSPDDDAIAAGDGPAEAAPSALPLALGAEHGILDELRRRDSDAAQRGGDAPLFAVLAAAPPSSEGGSAADAAASAPAPEAGQSVQLLLQPPPRRPPREQVLAQRGRCAGCGCRLRGPPPAETGGAGPLSVAGAMGLPLSRKIGAALLSPFLSEGASAFLRDGGSVVCEYSGRIYCAAKCMAGKHRRVLPWAAVSTWDFQPRRVADVVHEYLSAIHDQPVLCVSAVNPRLFRRIPLLGRMRERRVVRTTDERMSARAWRAMRAAHACVRLEPVPCLRRTFPLTTFHPLPFLPSSVLPLSLSLSLCVCVCVCVCACVRVATAQKAGAAPSRVGG